MVSFLTPDLNKLRGEMKKKERKKKKKKKKKEIKKNKIWCYGLYVSVERKRRRDAESERHVSRSKASFEKAMAR